MYYPSCESGVLPNIDLPEAERQDEIARYLAQLAGIWYRFPQLRLGQLLSIGANECSFCPPCDLHSILYSMKDKDLFTALNADTVDKAYKRVARRRE